MYGLSLKYGLCGVSGSRAVECDGDFTPVSEDDDAVGLTASDSGGVSCKLMRSYVSRGEGGQPSCCKTSTPLQLLPIRP